MTRSTPAVEAARPAVSAVVPVYNSEGTLESLVERLEAALTPITSAFEIVLVNDGSRDASWDIIRRLAGGHRHVRGLRLMRNFGQHNALLVGIRAARHATIVTLDDDLQNPPEEIGKLLAKLAEGYDVVYGKPVARQDGVYRRLGSSLLRWVLTSALGRNAALHASAFRAFRAELRSAFRHYRTSFVSIDALLAWGSGATTSVTVEHHPRLVGRSNYRFARLLVMALDVMTSFSTGPLRLASWMGFGLTAFGVLLLVWVLGRYALLGYSVPGFPFLASVISIFSGAQLFSLGIVGEYLARIHFRSMGRPYAVVRERVGFASTRAETEP
jgi:glycosyltransferase involved in cell wall biosynthesis